MATRSLPTNRKPKSNNANALKTLIMAGSLAGTIGGWAILAAGQLQNTVTTLTQPQQVVQPVSNTTANSSVNTLRQVTVPNTQPRALTRSRSSR